jgi:hypothetical protein
LLVASLVCKRYHWSVLPEFGRLKGALWIAEHFWLPLLPPHLQVEFIHFPHLPILKSQS